MIEIIGWVGAVTFAVCAAPQAWLSYKNKNSDGVSGMFLSLWAVGEICTIFYVYYEHGWDGPLMFNYLLNLAFLSVICYYKIR